MKKLSFVLLLLIVLADLANAQNFYSRRRNRTLMFSYGIGGAQYHGDLHDILYDGMNAATGFSVGAGLRKKFGDQLSVRFDINYYQVGGSDAENANIGTRIGRITGDDRYLRNLSFRSRNFEFSAVANFNLIPVKGSYSRRPIVNPYLIGGIGWTTVNAKAELDGEWYLLREYNTELGFAQEGEQEKAWRMVIPLGLGIRLKANQYIDILLEGARRFTFTDYLDDVSTFYPSRQDLIDFHGPEKGEIAYRLSNRRGELDGESNYNKGALRGISENNDAYWIFQIRLEMYLPDSFLSEIFSPSRRKPKFR